MRFVLQVMHSTSRLYFLFEHAWEQRKLSKIILQHGVEQSFLDTISLAEQGCLKF